MEWVQAVMYVPLALYAPYWDISMTSAFADAVSIFHSDIHDPDCRTEVSTRI